MTTDNKTEQPASFCTHNYWSYFLYKPSIHYNIQHINIPGSSLFGKKKKDVFKVIYKYRYILMTIIESKSFDNGCYQSLLHQYS